MHPPDAQADDRSPGFPAAAALAAAASLVREREEEEEETYFRVKAGGLCFSRRDAEHARMSSDSFTLYNCCEVYVL